jgi:hypothetical protein
VRMAITVPVMDMAMGTVRITGRPITARDMPTTADRIGGTVIGIVITGKDKSPDVSPGFFLLGWRRRSFVSRPKWRAVERTARSFTAARVFERADEVFVSLTSEFFLSGLESCHTRRNLGALPREPIVLFAHAHPLLSRVPTLLASEIGARIGIRRCKIVIVDNQAEEDR